jgi:SHS2 domain-containing protein
MGASESYWEHFPHGADVGVRGVGPTLEAAFESAAQGLIAVVTDPVHVQPRETVTVTLQAPDPEILLVDWFNAIIYEIATRRMLFGRFHVEIEGTRLKGTLEGESIAALRHEPAVELKGATFTALRVTSTDGQWMAQCVVDV